MKTEAIWSKYAPNRFCKYSVGGVEASAPNQITYRILMHISTFIEFLCTDFLNPSSCGFGNIANLKRRAVILTNYVVL